MSYYYVTKESGGICQESKAKTALDVSRSQCPFADVIKLLCNRYEPY